MKTNRTTYVKIISILEKSPMTKSALIDAYIQTLGLALLLSIVMQNKSDLITFSWIYTLKVCNNICYTIQDDFINQVLHPILLTPIIPALDFVLVSKVIYLLLINKFLSG